MDKARHYGVAEAKGSLLITFPALGGVHGPITTAFSATDAYARARDLLILNADVIDDPDAWAADIELVWIGTEEPLPYR